MSATSGDRTGAKFCSKCGAAFGDRARFCAGCGAPRMAAAPPDQVSAGTPLLSRLGTLSARGTSPVSGQPAARPVPSATEQPVTGTVDPSILGIGNDEAFALAFLAYERAHRAYRQQYVRCESGKTLAWAAFNLYVTVKNGLLQRWHETGETDHRLYTSAQQQPIERYRRLADQDGECGPDDARKLDALAKEWERATEAFAVALDVRVLRIDGDIAAVRAELALAERAFERRHELARSEMLRRNELSMRLGDSIERRRVLAREEGYAQRSTEAERTRIENVEIRAITDELESLAPGYGKATDTAEHLWLTEVRAVARGAEVKARKADRKAASEARKAERDAEARARQDARQTRPSPDPGQP